VKYSILFHCGYNLLNLFSLDVYFNQSDARWCHFDVFWLAVIDYFSVDRQSKYILFNRCSCPSLAFVVYLHSSDTQGPGRLAWCDIVCVCTYISCVAFSGREWGPIPFLFFEYFHEYHFIFLLIIFVNPVPFFFRVFSQNVNQIREYWAIGYPFLLCVLWSWMWIFWKSSHFRPTSTNCVSYSFISFSRFRIFAYILDTRHITFRLTENI